MISRQQFTKELEKEDYISNPMDYFYSHAPEDLPLVEGLIVIFLHNKDIIDMLREDNAELTKKLNVTTIFPQEPKEEIKRETIIEPQPRKESNIIELLTHTYDFDTITKIIDQSSKTDRPLIKLYYYKKLQDKKLELLQRISHNPLSNNQDLITKIEEYTLLLDYLEPQEEQKEEEKQLITNIIIVPNKSKSSYLYEDILNYLERSKEIKNALDKLLNEYYGKSTKSLKGYNNLYEYTHPNGIRILYVNLPNNKIGICSIFYKDKNKSTKITNYYEEALSRYNQNKEYILSNLNNPDFYLEQAEIIAEIYTELENNMPLTLEKEAE